MKAVFCTCNNTLPFQEKLFQKHLDQNISYIFTHAFCRDRDSVLESLGNLDEGLFISCGMERRCLRDTLSGSTLESNNVIAWDLKKLLAGVALEEVSRLACAYMETAQVLHEKRKLVPPAMLPVGHRLIVAGLETKNVVNGLADQLNILAVGLDDPGENVDFLCGTISDVHGTLGSFEVIVDCQTPVNPKICIDCGACVAVCPQEALDTSYRLDEKKCDQCMKCVQACGAIGAIELERKQLKLEADLVIWHKGSGLARTGFFLPTNQKQLIADGVTCLSMLSAEAVEAYPSINVYPEKCLHGYAETKGCSKCLLICPSEALFSNEDKVSVDQQKCIACYSCISACPTGALSSLPFDHQAWGTAIEKFVSLVGPSLPVLISCQACNTKYPSGHAVFPLSDGALLEAGHLLGAFNYGVGALTVMPCSCRQTPNDKDYDLAFEILNRIGMQGNLRHTPEMTAPNPVNFFTTGVAVDWTDKRTSLASVLEPIIKETSGEKPPLAGPFGTVSINSQACTGCGACVEACTVGTIRGDDENMSIMVREINCTGCGLCVKICPEDAIRVTPGLRWNKKVFAVLTQTQVDGLACRKCGKVFATRKAVESVAARLQERFGPQDLEHLMLCPDCRVVVSLTEG